MTSILKKATIGLAMAATAVTGIAASATPALADPYRGGGYYRGHGGDGAGVAIAAGVLGLAVGAAIASDHGPYYPAGYYAPYPVAYPAYPVNYVVSPDWVWRDGFYWDHYGHRFDRWGHPYYAGGYYRGGYVGGGYVGGGYGGYARGGYARGGYGGGAYRGGYAHQGSYAREGGHR